MADLGHLGQVGTHNGDEAPIGLILSRFTVSPVAPAASKNEHSTITDDSPPRPATEDRADPIAASPEQELEQAFASHDWHGHLSDYTPTVKKAEASEHHLLELAAKVPPLKVRAMWEHYHPQYGLPEWPALAAVLLDDPSSPAWDIEAANNELQQALAVIGAALSATWLTPSQRNLISVFRQQVEDYQARRDPLLFGAATWINGHVARWREEHQDAIRRN